MGPRSTTFLVIATISSLATVGTSIAGDNRWTSGGPRGGYISSIYYHPQVRNLVFASPSDGLLRSRDGGKSWERLNVAGTAFIVRIHPQQPDRVIAASREVYESTDRGDTWHLLCSNPIAEDYFCDVEFLPTSPTTLFAVTYRNGVYRSDDGGVTWQPRSSGLDLKHVFSACRPQLEIDPKKPQIMYVLLASRKAFKTTDGGTKWQAASNGLLFQGIDDNSRGATALAIDPQNPKTLFAGGWGQIFKTTDGAAQWSRLGEYSAVAISIDENNAETVYADGGREINKTTDGGATWKRFMTPPILGEVLDAIAVDPANGKFVLAGSCVGGIFRTTDSGMKWTTANRGIDDSALRHLAACPASKGLLVAQGAQMRYRSRDSGKKWETIGGGGNEVQVHPRDGNLIVAAAGSVSISTDGGQTWQETGPPGQGGNRVALDPVDENTMYVSTQDIETGQGLGMAKSTDRGQTWRFINSGLGQQDVTAIAIDPVHTATVYAGTSSGKIFKTTNRGSKWKDSSAGQAGGYIADMAVDPAHPNNVYFTGSAGTYKSSDGGRTWARRTEGAECVMVHPLYPRTLFVSRWGDISVSTDEGETWSAFDMTGLGPFAIHDLVADPANPEGFFAATERGVFSYTRKGSPGGPLIQQLSPAAGKAGDTVTVNGSGFGSLQGTSTVLFGGLDAGVAQFWSDTSVRVTVPTGVRTGYVTVTVLGRKSNRFEFIVLPSSGNVEPTSGPAAGGTRVTIIAPSGTSGTQFNVLFGSTVAANVRFTQPNVITCDSPAGTGTVDVKVTSSVTSTTVGTFTYQ